MSVACASYPWKLWTERVRERRVQVRIPYQRKRPFLLTGEPDRILGLMWGLLAFLQGLGLLPLVEELRSCYWGQAPSQASCCDCCFWQQPWPWEFYLLLNELNGGLEQ